MNAYRKNGGKAILMAANMDAEIVGSNYGFNSDRCITVHNSNEEAIESGFRSIGRLQREMTLGLEVTPITHIERVSSCPMANHQIGFANVDLQTVPTLVMQPPVLTRQHHALAWNDTIDTEQLQDNQAEI